jgi:hypothetical protein
MPVTCWPAQRDRPPRVERQLGQALARPTIDGDASHTRSLPVQVRSRDVLAPNCPAYWFRARRARFGLRTPRELHR